jgi:uncharacterized repeat protein (TIGR03803 family)
MHSLSRSLSVFSTLILITLVALPLAASVQDFTVLQNFNNTNGDDPSTPPILASDGNLYGATGHGGANAMGLVYKLTPQNKLTTLYAFCSQTNCTDGSGPAFGPIQGTDGNLYGTTYYGGANDLGVVYKLTLSGKLTVLHSFCLCKDGRYSNGLLADGQGGFYGSTLEGGSHQFGTIFHLTAQGKLTTLYNFCDSQPTCIDAYTNNGEFQPLILGVDGNIYGITTTGGQYYYLCSPGGCGTVFKITPQGQFSIVYNFCTLANCADGGQPAWLIQGSDGNFYGTTSLGGFEAHGGGTIFQLTTSGALNTLHSFSAAQDGTSGYAPYDLIQAANGTLYGITVFGGNEGQQCKNIGCGTVFSVTTSGAFGSLHSFDASDGYAPSGLVQTSDTTLSGTASFGGAHDGGVIFSLNLN